MSLDAANQARLEKSLKVQWRKDGQIYTLKELIDNFVVSFEAAEVMKYTWEHINKKEFELKLSPSEVKEMEQARKISYRAYINDREFYNIPKIVYDYYVNELGKPLHKED